MNISIFKKEKTSTGQISSVEAYNVWHSLRDCFGSIETFQIFDNFVHDRELSVFINNRISAYQKQIKRLESVAKQYKIKVPSRPPVKMILENSFC